MGAQESMPGQQAGPQASGPQAMMGKGELADESLPGAGGGSNHQGMMQ